jgi:hypothetical protein
VPLTFFLCHKWKGSSSFTPLNTSFSISYGSGSAKGVLGQDVVQFSGFEIQSQVFGRFPDSSAIT